MLNFIHKNIIFFIATISILLMITFFIFFSEDNDELSIFENCNIDEVEFIPKNSTIVIGHAYGSPLNTSKYSFISKKIELLLNKNKENIKIVVFTGDIFWEPSIKKWKKLYNDYNKYFQIHIAPGNHEVDSFAKTEIFKMSKFKSDDYYKFNIFNKNFFFIENSIINNWELNPELIKYFNNNFSNDITLFRHNIPVKELVQFANSKSLISKDLSSVKDLQKKLSKINNLTIISGDSGAFTELPRLTCHVYKNIKFITNGIGDIEKDKILIINNNKIYSHNLE